MAATIVDDIVVELQLDPSGKLKKASDEAQKGIKNTREGFKKAGDQIEESMKNVGQVIRNVRDQLIGLFAAFTAGKSLKDFVEDTTRTDAQLGRLSRTIGTSVETISTWSNAARQFGGSIEDTSATMKGLVGNFEEFQTTGQSSIIPYLRALHVGFTTTKDGLLDVNKLLLDFAEAAPKVPGGLPQANFLLKSIGIDDATIQIILKGKKATEELLEEQRKIGITTKANTEAAEKLLRSWTNMENAAHKVGQTLLTNFGPALQTIFNGIKNIADFANEHKDATEAFFVVLTTAVLALSAAIGVTLVKSITLATAAFIATPIGAITAAVVALGVAAYELYEHWDAFAKFWKSLWTTAVDDVAKAVKEIKSYLPSWLGGTASGGQAIQVPRPGAKTGGAATKGKTAAAGGTSDVAKLQALGWSKAQAEGIVANLQRESGGRTNAVGDNGAAYGLAQWHKDRQDDFAKFAGHDIRSSTRDEQLAFINYELRNKKYLGGDKLKQATDAGQAAAIFSRNFERPDKADYEASLRANLANGGQGALGYPGGSGAGSTSTTTIGEINIQTKATDADGIARDIKPALDRNVFSQQANYGAN